MVKVPLKRVPSEQKLQPPKRVSSVGPSQRRDNCQKLIEHYKAEYVNTTEVSDLPFTPQSIISIDKLSLYLL